jgi:23S rRNA pseudouridine1911/1915/1917 synthase
MSVEKQINTIPDELAGLRLDQALARIFPEYSRNRLKDWLLTGAITVQGGPKRPRDRVFGGEIVELVEQVGPSVRAEAEPIMLDIVHEDDQLLVVNKAAGLVVHPGAGNPAGTLMNGLLHQCPALEEIPRAGIIHRLDKDTSGLLVVAKTLTTHTALLRLLEDRKISRHYLALCKGVLTGGGSISEPISRHPIDRKRMSVQQNGKPSVTHFTVKERFEAFTFVNVKLETGRTHQIRVHFAYRRHALVGDQIYGGRLALPKGASEEMIQVLRHFKRQALHAARLAFIHPTTEKLVDLEIPPPKDFMMLVDVMRRDAAGD